MAGVVVEHVECTAHRTQRFAQFLHAFPKELDPAVGAVLQPVEDLAVEYENALHRRVRLEGRIQGGMIGKAQIAAEPDEGRVSCKFSQIRAILPVVNVKRGPIYLIRDKSRTINESLPAILIDGARLMMRDLESVPRSWATPNEVPPT